MTEDTFPVRAPRGHEAELGQSDPGGRWYVRTRPVGRDWWSVVNTQDAPDPARAAFDVRRWVENEPARNRWENEWRMECIARWGSE